MDTYDGQRAPLNSSIAFFNTEGPRFSLPAADVAGVFPPRNPHGPFDNSLLHIALLRRTLPWERDIDPQDKTGDPDGTGVPAPAGNIPWMALLLLEGSEYRLLQNQPLEQVVPKAVCQALGSPPNITCDAIDVRLDLLNANLPSKEDLQVAGSCCEHHTRRLDRQCARDPEPNGPTGLCCSTASTCGTVSDRLTVEHTERLEALEARGAAGGLA
jgi:hypothetical protein